MAELSPLVVTFTGVAIVFLLLVFLVLIISIFGFFGKSVGGKDKKNKKAEKKAPAVSVKKSDEPLKMVKTPVVMEIEEGIPSEVIAAISAAVAYTSEGNSFAIRSIRRERKSRPSWATAGILDNTRPF